MSSALRRHSVGGECMTAFRNGRAGTRWWWLDCLRPLSAARRRPEVGAGRGECCRALCYSMACRLPREIIEMTKDVIRDA